MMNKVRFIIAMVIVVLTFTQVAVAEGDIWERDTITDGFWGLNDRIADSGLELALGVTNVYQQNISGGTSKLET